jgi:hypothetical protein
MLAEIDTSIYDVIGTSVAQIRRRHRLAGPSLPFGRFFTMPLAHHCDSLEAIRGFLLACEYVSDRQQFGKADYWQPPDQFEATRRGDCEDFALWAWRQLVSLGYECRFVGGSAGFYGAGHAWLTVRIGEAHYLMESLACRYEKLPRLKVARYQPIFSARWTEERVSLFEHTQTKPFEQVGTVLPLLPEWLTFQAQRVAISARAIRRRLS